MMTADRNIDDKSSSIRDEVLKLDIGGSSQIAYHVILWENHVLFVTLYRTHYK